MHTTGSSSEGNCPLFSSTLCVSCLFSYSITLIFSLSPSPSVCIDRHTYALSSRLPCVSPSLRLRLFDATTAGIWVAVGTCSQSFWYSAFSSCSTCPSLCVSTACLNNSHQGHYWEHSSPPPFTTYLPLISENSSGWHRWSVGVQGTFPGFSSQWSEWCLSSFTENHSLFGWIIKSLPDGTECIVNLCGFRLSYWSRDDQESTVLDLTET